MAEPTGIFIEIDIDENGIKKLLNHKFITSYGNKLGYYFSELLYNCNAEPANVFIFSHDPKTNRCFMVWLLNHFNIETLKPFDAVLQIICSEKTTKTTDYAIVATTFPEVLYSYQITIGAVKKITQEATPSDIIKRLSDKFWSFSENNDFPAPNKALTKRNYLHKNFKNYYKKYLVHIEEIEKPYKISLATKENPYHLFDKFYAYENKVFEFRTYNNQKIELPKADPISFRNVAGINADKNYVYLIRLAPNSPPNSHPKWPGANNPNSKWEYYIAEGVDGNSFEYVKAKWDTIYWKDKNSVFIYENKKLQKLEHADSKTFKYLDFCFGMDKTHVFYLDKKIPIDMNKFTLNKNGFIYDDKNIFHYQHQILLDPKTFKILKYESDVNPFIGNFILEDKRGKYEYNRDLESQQLRSITI